jgi:hypothetical protein
MIGVGCLSVKRIVQPFNRPYGLFKRSTSELRNVK